MSVYVAYSDESAANDPVGEFLVGGYVANEKDWPRIASEWQERVLDGPPLIPYLHMTEIRSPTWRNKHGLDWPKANKRVIHAVKVLSRAKSMLAIASVIKRSDLKEILQDKYSKKKKIPIGINEPDYICYQAFMSLVLYRIKHSDPDVTRVNFMVSEKEQISKNLPKVTSVIKRYLSEHEKDILPLMGDVIPVSMERHLPLQAADVLCWHLQRYYAGTKEDIDHYRMWKLLKERDGNLHVWAREDLQEAALAIDEMRESEANEANA